MNLSIIATKTILTFTWQPGCFTDPIMIYIPIPRLRIGVHNFWWYVPYNMLHSSMNEGISHSFSPAGEAEIVIIDDVNHPLVVSPYIKPSGIQFLEGTEIFILSSGKHSLHDIRKCISPVMWRNGLSGAELLITELGPMDSPHHSVFRSSLFDCG